MENKEDLLILVKDLFIKYKNFNLKYFSKLFQIINDYIFNNLKSNENSLEIIGIYFFTDCFIINISKFCSFLNLEEQYINHFIELPFFNSKKLSPEQYQCFNCSLNLKNYPYICKYPKHNYMDAFVHELYGLDKISSNNFFLNLNNENILKNKKMNLITTSILSIPPTNYNLIEKKFIEILQKYSNNEKNVCWLLK